MNKLFFGTKAAPKDIEIQEQLAFSQQKSSRSRALHLLYEKNGMLDGSEETVSSSHDHHQRQAQQRTFNQTLESLNLLEKYLNTKQMTRRSNIRVQAQEKVQFICRTNGSRPQARLSWWISTSGTKMHNITHLR